MPPCFFPITGVIFLFCLAAVNHDSGGLLRRLLALSAKEGLETVEFGVGVADVVAFAPITDAVETTAAAADAATTNGEAAAAFLAADAAEAA